MLASEEIITSITLSGLSFDIDSVRLVARDVVKMFSIALVCFSVVIILFIFSLKQLLKIMTIVKNGTPFTLECVKSIKILGTLVIISSFVVPTVASLIGYLEIKTFNLENLLLSSPNISNVTYNLFSFDGTPVLIGFIILILAGVFQYGCYLQDEYDSTL